MRRRRGVEVSGLRRLRRCHRQASTVPHTAGPPAFMRYQPLLPGPEAPQSWLQAARPAIQWQSVRHLCGGCNGVQVGGPVIVQ